MNMSRTLRGILALALGTVSIASTCQSSDDRVPGTYRLNIIESRDTCDNPQELNTFGSQLTISQEGDSYIIEFGEEGTLTGAFSDEGVLVAEGDIVVVRDGTPIAAHMQIGIIIRQGQITAGTGRLTFNGTFPGRPGVCIQEFSVTGRRDNVSPVLG
jgi:hypothetical protein